MRKLPIPIILCIFISTGFCEHYYVSDSEDASDFNPGTFSSPFSTIAKAASLTVPGDTVDVFCGIYYESVLIQNSGSLTSPIIYRAYPGSYVTIKAQIDYGFKIPEGVEYIIIEGFRITEAVGGASEIHGAGIEIQGNNNIAKYNHVYNNDIGIFVKTFTLDTSITNHYNTVIGNIFSDSHEAGLRIKRSNNTTVLSNLFYHNAFITEPSGGITYYGSDTTYIINNTFWNNNGPAIINYNGTDQEATPVTRNTLMINNILARDFGRPLIEIQSNMVNEPTNIYSHNLFWNEYSDSIFILWGRENTGEGGYILNYESFLDSISALNPLSGIGDIVADPLFENPDAFIFDLLSLSPAFNAGDSTITGLGLVGMTAASDQMHDIGTPDLGYHHLPFQYSINPPVYYTDIIKIYPNPGEHVFKFQLQLRTNNVPVIPTVNIYNILGQKMAEISGRDDNVMNYFELEWNPPAYAASGVYYAVIQSPGTKYCKTLLLLK